MVLLWSDNRCHIKVDLYEGRKKYELRIHMIKSKVAGQNSWLLIRTALGSSTNGDQLYGKSTADKAVEDFLLLIKN